MARTTPLFSVAFVTINVQFALVTSVAAAFFAYSGYLTRLGVSPTEIGFILSADALAALILQPVLAPIIRVDSSRLWLFAASVVLSFSLFLMSRATTYPMLLTARLLQGAGFIGVISALTTMLVSCIPPGRSGAAFGWASLIRLVPYAVIPFLFDRLKVTPEQFPLVLRIAVWVPLSGVLLIAVPVAPRNPADQRDNPPGYSGVWASLRSMTVLFLLLSVLLLFIGYSAVFFYLKQYGDARRLANVSLFFPIATSMMALARLAGGWLFDRFSKVALSATALATVALGYFAIAIPSSEETFYFIAGLCGLGWGIAIPLQAAFMHDLSAESSRPMNQNLLLAMMQGGFVLGPILGARIIEDFGYGGLFVGLGLLTLAASFAVIAAGRSLRRGP